MYRNTYCSQELYKIFSIWQSNDKGIWCKSINVTKYMHIKRQFTVNNKIAYQQLFSNHTSWHHITNMLQQNKNVLTSSKTTRSAGKRREASDFTTEYNVCSALCWHSGSLTRMASSRAGISCGQLRGQSRRAIFPIKTDNCTAI